MRLFKRKKKRSGEPSEFLQVSTTDCGPAVMASILDSFGASFSYEALREQCQTDADGTSTESLEEVLLQYGFEASLAIVPREHLLIGSQYTPSILMVGGGGLQVLHFVLYWNPGPPVVLMDPAKGIDKKSHEEILKLVYMHSTWVPAEDWDDFSKTEEFLDPLMVRLERLVGRKMASQSLKACVDEGCKAISELDAATRMMENFVDEGVLAKSNCAAFWRRITEDRKPVSECIHESYYYAHQKRDDPSQYMLRGSVVLPIKDLRDTEEFKAQQAAIEETLEESATVQSQAADETATRTTGHGYQTRMFRQGLEFVSQQAFSVLGKRGLVAMALLATTMALTTLIESLLFYSLASVQERLVTPERMWGFLGVLLGCFVIFFFTIYLRETLMRLVGRYIEFGFRGTLLEVMENLAPRFFESRAVADITMRLHSIGDLGMVLQSVFGLIQQVVTFVVLTAALFIFDPMIGVCVLVASVIRSAYIARFYTKSSALQLRMGTQSGALAIFYQQALGGRMPIVAHAAEDIVISEHESQLANWSRSAREFIEATTLVSVIEQLIYMASFGTVVYLAFDEGILLIVVAYWFSMVMGSVSQLSNLMLMELPGLRGSLLRMFEPFSAGLDSREQNELPGSKILARENTLRTHKPAIAIEMDGVSVVLKRNHVLKNVHLRIPAGAHVAIVGRSGSGKSTLMSAVLKTVPITEGRILFDGVPVTEKQHEELVREMTWIDPDVHLWNETMWRNICGIGQGSDTGFENIVEDAGLSAVVQALPLGASSPVGEEGRLLSGGEGQRVRIARAMAQGFGPIVCLDEAFRGIDPDLKDIITKRVRERASGSTLLCVTHDIATALGFDFIAVVSEGQVIEFGPPASLLLHPDAHFNRMLEQYRDVKSDVWGANSTFSKVKLHEGKIKTVPRLL